MGDRPDHERSDAGMSDGGPGDHREALAAIPDAEMTALRRVSDRAGLIQLGGHLGLLTLTGTGILMSDGLWRIPAILVHGIVLVFLFAPLHETIHGTAFRTPWLNRLVSTVAGFVILLPPVWFSFFHFAHHRHTQDPDRDPELRGGGIADIGTYLYRLTGWPYWRGQVATIISMALGRQPPDFVPPRARPRVWREARLFLAGYVFLFGLSVLFQSALLVWLWVLPVLVGQPFLRAYLMAEHTACPLIPDMLRNTRTTFASPVVRWLAWQMPNHTAHHAAPQVPFHRLPALTDLLERQLRSTADGYPDAHRQIVTALRAPAPASKADRPVSGA